MPFHFHMLNAQNTSIHTEIENLSSKKYLFKKDKLKLDSLLSLIEVNYGIQNEDYFLLANLKIRGSMISDSKSLFPVLKKLDELYYKGYGDSIQYENFLRKKCKICRFSREVNEDSLFNDYARLWELHKRNLAENDTVDFKLLDDYSSLCSLKRRFELLYALKAEALNLNKSIYSVKSVEYDRALKELLISCGYRMTFDEMDEEKKKEFFVSSSNFYKEWLSQHDIKKNIKDDEYNNIFNSYTDGLIFLINDTIEARNLLDKYCVAIKEVYGENSEQYYNALKSKKFCYTDEESIPIQKEMLNVAERVWGKDSYQYQTDLSSLSLLMQIQGNLREAVKLNNNYNEETYINSLFDSSGFSDISEESKKTLSDFMNKSQLSSNSILNSMYGNWTEANNNLKTLLYSCLNNLDDPLSQLNFQSSYLSLFNNYRAQNETDSIVVFGQEFLPHIDDDNVAIQVLTSINSSCMHGEALNFVTNTITERPSLSQCVEYPTLLESIADIKGRKGDLAGAFKAVDEAFLLRENTEKNQIRKLIQEEILLALNKKYVDAFELNKKAMGLFSQVPGYDTYLEYAGLRMRACLEGVRLGQYEQVIKDGEYIRSLDYPNTNLSSYLYDNMILSQYSSMFYLLQMPLKNYVTIPLIDAYVNTHANEKALALLKEYAKDTEETIKSSLALIGPKNGTINIQNICDIAQGELAKSAVALNNSQINELAFNNALLSKQLLLNASERMKKLIMNSGDEEILNKYNELINTQTMIDNAAYTGLSVDSLYQRKRSLEVQLNADSKLFGDYTKDLNCSWNDIQEVLKEGECAIEFVQYTEDEINYQYTALVLLPNKEPIPIYICSDNDIENIKDPYSDTGTAKMIWGPIISKIGNTQTIYFSPTGKLHILGMENLMLSDSTLISDKYKLYRLSSTRMLLDKVTQKGFTNGILYGGLTYDEDVQTMIDNGSIYNTTNVYRSYHVGDSLNLRNGVSYLPSTKAEIDGINKLLNNSNIHFKSFTAEKGTEDSFKSFSGQAIDFIHVATHGFYWNEKEAKANSRLGFIASFLGNNTEKEDQAMARSGLLFAGANNALMSKSIPNNIDDGILTAKEISLLDLNTVDIVVLSACQTGLGEISGDGVFGLQRGFKKAGAKTLLMSLWKVDDKATQLFMSYFYKNLVSGNSKQEALSKAQHELREYEIEKETTANQGRRPLTAHERSQQSQKVKIKIKPYKDPRYWAGFILLDAIQ